MGQAVDAYIGSDATKTRALCAQLEKLGPNGIVASRLFRAQKASERAKKYRGGIKGVGSYKALAYAKKNETLQELARSLYLTKFAWGWKQDPAAPGPHKWVIYVDLPSGQVSFHSEKRYIGPNYEGDWDGIRGVGPRRICDYCERLLHAEALRMDPDQKGLFDALKV